MGKRVSLISCFLVLLITVSCTSRDETTASVETTGLPMNEMQLSGLDSFRDHSDNWKIVGSVQSDYETDLSVIPEEGTGVLLNLPTNDENSNIFTDLDHGDIEIKLEFLVPKGSNSGIYFQGRYELQIVDSWSAEDLNFGSLGGIYQRWDDSQPAGEEGYEGYAPRVNAARAPGLWQEFHVLFRAPRFDAEGNKIQNAMFEEVYLNGILIHEDVELSGPTRGALVEGEGARGPIAIQGDHGPVAFRNINYKLLNQTDVVTLSDLTYTVYDYNGNILPDFDTLSTVIAEGTTPYFDPSDQSPQNDHYAIWYTGTLDIPVAGDYLFQTQLSKGGNLYINDELILPNNGEIDYLTIGNIVHLPAGSHKLDLSYFQITWSTNISLFFEGPNMEKSRLGAEPPQNRGGGGGGGPSPIVINPEETVELIGGFVNYNGEKRTHVISVGSPEGIHYNYDLGNAEPLNYWKGSFADVSQMWRGRGESQRLAPMNAVISETSGIPLVELNENDSIRLTEESEQVAISEYVLNDSGRPVFQFGFQDIQIEDELAPNNDASGLNRTLRYQSENSGTGRYGARIAQGNQIELLSNGLYRVDGYYYIRLIDTGNVTPMVLTSGDRDHLVIPVLRNSTQSNVQYSIIW